MRVRVLKDATVTVTAGQVVDIREDVAAAAVRLGLVAPYHEEVRPVEEEIPEERPKKRRKR